eukprot:EG_transcript_7801
MASEDFFSASYVEARAKFQAATATAPLRYRLELKGKDGGPLLGMEGEPLTIDIAGYGNVTDPSRVFFHTSGVHGVEGFAGSAIQLAALQLDIPTLGFGPTDCLLLVHGWNPFGMSWHRRWNENNVDLNRNFFPFPHTAPADPWLQRGTTENYHMLHSLLNPTELHMLDTLTYYLCTAFFLARYGLPFVKQAVVEGQEAYPEGLFFGGRQLEQSNALVRDWLLQFLQRCPRVTRFVNINVHTGLGPYGFDSLLVDESDVTAGMRRHYGEAHLQISSEKGLTSNVGYFVQGVTEHGLQHVLKSVFPEVELHCCTQEFGTYRGSAVLRALRAENVAWQQHWQATGRPLPAGDPAKRRVLEVFYVDRADWKAAVLARGRIVFQQAVQLAFE